MAITLEECDHILETAMGTISFLMVFNLTVT